MFLEKGAKMGLWAYSLGTDTQRSTIIRILFATMMTCGINKSGRLEMEIYIRLARHHHHHQCGDIAPPSLRRRIQRANDRAQRITSVVRGEWTPQ